MNSLIPSHTEITADSSQLPQPLFSFGVIADVQYANCDPVGTRFYRSSAGKLDEALKSFKNDSVDFVVTLGDLIDRDLSSYKDVMPIVRSSGLKFHHVTGNHDYNIGDEKIRKIPSDYQSQKGYYAFIHHNFRFIFLNGNEISLYGTSAKSTRKKASALLDSLRAKGAPNAMEWNGGISSRQMLWFEKQLNEAELNNEKVLIFCHFPVFPENAHNLLNDSEVLELLRKHKNIIAWINGHNHAGNYGNTNSIHFVTLKGMVETKDKNSYARIDVYRNKIWIVGEGREKNQILAY